MPDVGLLRFMTTLGDGMIVSKDLDYEKVIILFGQALKDEEMVFARPVAIK